jgi:hypothetical protein
LNWSKVLLYLYNHISEYIHATPIVSFRFHHKLPHTNKNTAAASKQHAVGVFLDDSRVSVMFTYHKLLCAVSVLFCTLHCASSIVYASVTQVGPGDGPTPIGCFKTQCYAPDLGGVKFTQVVLNSASATIEQTISFLCPVGTTAEVVFDHAYVLPENPFTVVHRPSVQHKNFSAQCRETVFKFNVLSPITSQVGFSFNLSVDNSNASSIAESSNTAATAPSQPVQTSRSIEWTYGVCHTDSLHCNSSGPAHACCQGEDYWVGEHTMDGCDQSECCCPTSFFASWSLSSASLSYSGNLAGQCDGLPPVYSGETYLPRLSDLEFDILIGSKQHTVQFKHNTNTIVMIQKANPQCDAAQIGGDNGPPGKPKYLIPIIAASGGIVLFVIFCFVCRRQRRALPIGSDYDQDLTPNTALLATTKSYVATRRDGPGAYV